MDRPAAGAEDETNVSETADHVFFYYYYYYCYCYYYPFLACLS